MQRDQPHQRRHQAETRSRPKPRTRHSAANPNTARPTAPTRLPPLPPPTPRPQHRQTAARARYPARCRPAPPTPPPPLDTPRPPHPHRRRRPPPDARRGQDHRKGHRQHADRLHDHDRRQHQRTRMHHWEATAASETPPTHVRDRARLRNCEPHRLCVSDRPGRPCRPQRSARPRQRRTSPPRSVPCHWTPSRNASPRLPGLIDDRTIVTGCAASAEIGHEAGKGLSSPARRPRHRVDTTPGFYDRSRPRVLGGGPATAETDTRKHPSSRRAGGPESSRGWTIWTGRRLGLLTELARPRRPRTRIADPIHGDQGTDGNDRHDHRKRRRHTAATHRVAVSDRALPATRVRAVPGPPPAATAVDCRRARAASSSRASTTSATTVSAIAHGNIVSPNPVWARTSAVELTRRSSHSPASVANGTLSTSRLTGPQSPP